MHQYLCYDTLRRHKIGRGDHVMNFDIFLLVNTRPIYSTPRMVYMHPNVCCQVVYGQCSCMVHVTT